jgi:RimJ/RimL family protein N-acetyltransferase
LRDRDIEEFAAMHADARVVAHLHDPMTRTESEIVLQRIRANTVRDGVGPFAVEVPGRHDFIGLVGLGRPRFEAPFMPCVEIAWRIASPHWGQGYATEAARACLSYGFTYLDTPEILAWTSRDNLASQRVMEKLGMVRDPTSDFDHPKLAPGDRLRRHLVWRIRRP